MRHNITVEILIVTLHRNHHGYNLTKRKIISHFFSQFPTIETFVQIGFKGNNEKQFRRTQKKGTQYQLVNINA